MPTGFLLVDKPIDWTSHDVVGYLRGITKIRKIGHAGTLDPFATGLLIVAIERASTKRIDEFHAYKKTYIATMQLGAISNTQDKTGTIVHNAKTTNTISALLSDTKKLLEVFKTFEGPQEQIPPMFSAKKIKGKSSMNLREKE